LAEELKQPSQQWYSTVRRCVWALFEGRFEDAEQLAEEALGHGERAIAWDAGCSYRLVLFVLRREQGRLEEIEMLLRQAVNDYPGYRAFPCLLALLACESGRDAEARVAFDDLAAGEFKDLPRDCEWLFCLSILSEVASYLDDRERAASLYELLRPFAGLNALAAGEVALGAVSRYVGIDAAATERWTVAERHFKHAIEMNGRMGARPWVAHTKEDFARMLFARDKSGDADRAQQLLGEALTTYEELGMRGPLQRAQTGRARLTALPD
jgi:tetratricopeptide (TPR) repeat protein